MDAYKKDHILFVAISHMRLNDPWQSKLNFTIRILITMNAIVLSFFHLVYVDFDKGYMHDFVQDFTSFLTFGCVLAAMFTMRWNRESIEVLMEMLNDFTRFGVHKNFKERKAFMDKVSTYVKYLMHMSTFGYTITGIVDKAECHKENELLNKYRFCGLALQVYIPEEYHTLPVLIIIIFLHQLAFLQISSTFGGIYNIIMSATEYLVLRVEHLIHSIDDFSSENSVVSRKDLKTFVLHHKHVIKICDHINLSYSRFLLQSKGLYGILLGLILYELLVDDIEIKVVIHFIPTAGALLAMNLAGQRLLDVNKALKESVSNLPWYNSELPIQRDVNFVIQRIQYPFGLKTGEVGFLSLSTASETIRGAYSFITMMLQTTKK